MAEPNGDTFTIVSKDARASESIAAADFLSLAISELQRAERHIRTLALVNEALAKNTRAYIAATLAEIER